MTSKVSLWLNAIFPGFGQIASGQFGLGVIAGYGTSLFYIFLYSMLSPEIFVKGLAVWTVFWFLWSLFWSSQLFLNSSNDYNVGRLMQYIKYLLLIANGIVTVTIYFLIFMKV